MLRWTASLLLGGLRSWRCFWGIGPWAGAAIEVPGYLISIAPKSRRVPIVGPSLCLMIRGRSAIVIDLNCRVRVR